MWRQTRTHRKRQFVTQSFLVENRIRNMDDLRAKLPALNLADISSADWIASIRF